MSSNEPRVNDKRSKRGLSLSPCPFARPLTRRFLVIIILLCFRL
jgi:hypothetical protein